MPTSSLVYSERAQIFREQYSNVHPISLPHGSSTLQILFQKEHTAFLKFVSGITDRADQEWYASVMLNRLMFVYFIQRKGFLDGARDYLRNRLSQMREERGKDKFYSFYRYFLLRLFHEALGSKERSADLEGLVGHIPYLNGGLFDVHELEKSDRYGTSIQIPDQAFERIFDYFDQVPVALGRAVAPGRQRNQSRGSGIHI